MPASQYTGALRLPVLVMIFRLSRGFGSVFYNTCRAL
jgi:hypothetical protein